MPFLKMLALFITLGFLHILAGGYLHVLWWPFQFGMTVTIYAGFYLSMIGPKTPKHADPSQVWQTGKASLWPAGVVPLLLSLIHAASYVDDPQVLAKMIAAALVSPVYSIIIFGAFFRPPSAKLANQETGSAA